MIRLKNIKIAKTEFNDPQRMFSPEIGSIGAVLGSLGPIYLNICIFPPKMSAGGDRMDSNIYEALDGLLPAAVIFE